jgi:hypothetical protein
MDRSAQKGAAARYLLSTLVDFATDEGVAWPSIETLAHKLGLSQRQTNRLIRKLADSGEVVIEGGGGRHQTKRYRINPALINPDIHDRVTHTTPWTPETGFIPTNGARNPDISGSVTLTNMVKNPDIDVTPLIKNSQRTIIKAADAPASAHARQVRKRKQKKRTAETTWPDRFSLSPEMRAFAAEHGVNAELQFELFHAKALEKTWTSGNWRLKWTQFLLHAQRFAAERPERNGASRLSPPARKLPTATEVGSARAVKREH